MKARIPALLLILALAGCAKKPAEVAPLSGDEKFSLLNQGGLTETAKQAAEQAKNNTKEAKVRAETLAAYQATKEYKAAESAQSTAVELAKKAEATPEAKAFNVANAAAIDAAKTTKEAKDFDSLLAASIASQEDIFKKRGISPKTHYICKGPTMAFIVNGIAPDTAAIDETCKGVPDSGLELRALKPVVKK